MSPDYDTLVVSGPAPHVAQLAFNRPAAMNAINTQTGRDMLHFFEHLDPSRVRVVILTGTGDRAFSAGGDLKERQGMTDEAWLAQHALFEQVTFRLIDCPVALIAAVNGVAFGGGCELALCCDFIYASSAARFGLTEARLGIMPGGGGTQTLPRAVGARRARELIFSAPPFSAQEAASWGMVNRVCQPEALLAETVATASRIAANAPLSIRQAKKSINNGAAMDLHAALNFEIEAYNRLVATQDRHEGVRAFNEKRAADFQGR